MPSSEPFGPRRIAGAIEGRFDSLNPRAGNPDKAGRDIVKILNAKKPKMRYTVGLDAGAARVLTRVVPFKVRASILRLLLVPRDKR